MDIAKSFTAVGSAAPILVKDGDTGTYSVSGTFVGTVVIEKSEDGGTTWVPKRTITGTVTASNFTGSSTSGSGTSLHRFTCTAYTSGTIVTDMKNTYPTQDYGLDLATTLQDQYGDTPAVNKADLRITNDIVIMNGTAVPTDATTGAGFAGPGSLYIRVSGSSSKIYINGNTKASPTWKLVTSA